MPGRLQRIARAAAAVCDHAAALVCAVLILATTAGTAGYQAGIGLPWLDDVLRMLLMWLVYLGAVSLCLHDDHISMDALYPRLPPAARRALDVAKPLLGAGLCAFTAKIGYDSMRQAIAYGETLPSGDLPAWPRDLVIPLCFALMAAAYLVHLLSRRA